MTIYPDVWSQIRNEYQLYRCQYDLFAPAHAIAINAFFCKSAGADVCTNSKEHTCTMYTVPAKRNNCIKVNFKMSVLWNKYPVFLVNIGRLFHRQQKKIVYQQKHSTAQSLRCLSYRRAILLGVLGGVVDCNGVCIWVFISSMQTVNVAWSTGKDHWLQREFVFEYLYLWCMYT